MFKTNQQKETMTKIYMSDEDKMMKDKSIKWSQSSVINNDFKLDYQAIGDCYYDI